MKNKTLVYYIWISCISFLVLTLGIFILNFRNNEISDKPEVWGQFGDYFGGIMNPIVSIINLIILTYLSIRLVKNDDDRNKWTLQELARPYGDLEFDSSNKSIKISILNCGLGPMIIKDINISSDKGISYKNFSAIITKPESTSKCLINTFSITSHCVLSKDSEIVLLNIESENATTYIEQLKEKLQNFTLSVKYEDMYHREMECLTERIDFSVSEY